MTTTSGWPEASHRVVLTIGDEIVGWFSECAGLTIERRVEEFREGGVNDHQAVLPGPVHQGNVTLRRGLASPTLWQWFLAGSYDAKVQRQNVTITFLDGQGEAAATWNLIGAYPRKVGGVSLGASENQIAVEEVELAQGGEGGGDGAGGGEAGGEAPEGGAIPAAKPPVDIEKLAGRVYCLLSKELRIERDRLVW
jgi:phage tail-like protein